jgi:translation initiation factor 1
MNKKNKKDDRVYVYSTDPNFQLSDGENLMESLPPHQQRLKIRIDKKKRAGKIVTLIEGFVGKENDLEELGRKLKNLCGSGGSVKDKEIIIQGDHREKLRQWMVKNGYGQTKVV